MESSQKEFIRVWDGFGMMRIENRKKTGRKQKVVKKDLDRCENGMAMMRKWYGMTVERKQKEAKENRKDIEMKDKGSGTKGETQKGNRKNLHSKQKGK